MSRLRLRVVKIGGSLFDLPDLADRIHEWLANQSPGCNVLIAGGGPLVDEVRRWHDTHPIDEEVAHWMCIDLMSVTARLLHSSLSDTSLTDDILDLRHRPVQPACVVFDSAHWLRDQEPASRGRQLPIGWQVTSDSIAARLAKVLDAAELVLMKSSLPTNDCDLHGLADAGYVDEAFPILASGLRSLRFVDLRHGGSLLVRGTENEAQHDHP